MRDSPPYPPIPGDGRTGTIEEPISPAGECTTNKDCGDETGCMAICDNNKCLNTGRYLCPNEKACVTSQAHCDCQNENGGSGCKPCIENCRIGSGVCIKTGKIVCPTGECWIKAPVIEGQPYDPTSLCPNCPKTCDSTCEYCDPLTDPPQCTKNSNKKCASGECVPTIYLCPEQCSKPCKPCTQVCDKNSDGSTYCKDSGNKYCPDGSCRPSNFDCTQIKS